MAHWKDVFWARARDRGIQSVQAAADYLGIPRTTLRHYLENGAEPSVTNAIRMARFCEVTVEEMFGPEARIDAEVPAPVREQVYMVIQEVTFDALLALREKKGRKGTAAQADAAVDKAADDRKIPPDAESEVG